jgi:RNA polymerase sigma-32 factor
MKKEEKPTQTEPPAENLEESSHDELEPDDVTSFGSLKSAAIPEFEEPITMDLSPLVASTDLVRFDPLERYLAEIRTLDPLSREEEHALAVRFKETGDKMAGYKLVLANLRLVVMIAREYQRNVQNILDLVQEGNIGLLEAIQQYDPYRGVRFPSYAVYWIRAYMLRYIINNIRLVKVGTTQAQRKLFFNLNKERERLEAEGFVPEARLLAERLNVKESEVLEMEQRLALPDLSIDGPSSTSDESFDLHGILPDGTPSTEDQVANQQLTIAIREAVEEFKLDADEKERAIIERRLFTDEPQTLQEIADEFKLSRERIRQIEARLKERLKEFLKDRLRIDDIEDVSLEPS